MKNIYPNVLKTYQNKIQLWDDIVSHKPKKLRHKLKRYRSIIKKRYDFYETNVNSLDKIRSLGQHKWQHIASALEECYGNNITLDKVRRLFLQQVYKCPYCRINQADTLDHYFNKKDYPEYAVFILNLVPCCFKCNNIKRDNVFKDQHRSYIHFYFDTLPEYQFLYMRFFDFKNDNIPKIEIYLDFAQDERLKDQIYAHFDKLNLIYRYEAAVKNKLPETIRLLSCMSFSENKKIIKNFYDSCQKEYGINYWETCMYEGILNSTDFITHYSI